MKYSELVLGNNYITKIGNEYKQVKLINLRKEQNLGKAEKDKEVIVYTEAKNSIYRLAKQLKEI